MKWKVAGTAGNPFVVGAGSDELVIGDGGTYYLRVNGVVFTEQGSVSARRAALYGATLVPEPRELTRAEFLTVTTALSGAAETLAVSLISAALAIDNATKANVFSAPKAAARYLVSWGPFEFDPVEEAFHTLIDAHPSWTVQQKANNRAAITSFLTANWPTT